MLLETEDKTPTLINVLIHIFQENKITDIIHSPFHSGENS